MADTKISALTAHTTPIDTDLLPIVDVTGNETKKITRAVLLAAVVSVLETGWYPLTGTFTPRQQAFTNDPAAGSNISLSMTDTSGFVVGDIVNVSSSAGNENATITVVTANTSITVDALALNHTTTNRLVIHATSNRTFILMTSVDHTSRINVSDKIKFTDSTVKYGIVHVVTSTYILFYGGTDYSVASASAVTSVHTSHVNPVGFPMDPLKWTERFVDLTERSQSTPSQNGYYNNNGNKLRVPIGLFDLSFQAVLTVSDTSATTTDLTYALSTSASSNTDTELSGSELLYGASGTLIIRAASARRKIIETTAPTYYYFVVSSGLAGMATIRNSFLIIEAKCAYL